MTEYDHDDQAGDRQAGDRQTGDGQLAREQAERAERIRRLQERRGTAATRNRTAAAHDRAPATARGAAPRPATSGRRRRKHYNASRIVLAGLSVTSFFTIIGTLGAANQSQPAATAPTATATNTAPAAQAPAAVTGRATPANTSPAPHAKPVTRTHGS
jgi:hypothetical protein